MKVTNKITIHLDDLREIRPVDVMQCDVHTRELEIALFAGGKKWEIPNSVTPVISYRKPDGTKGLYDTLPNGNPACRIEANVVRAVLPPSALEAPGRVDLVLIFTDDDDNQLAAFGVPVDVHRNPGVGAVASGDYFNLQKWVRDEAAKVAKVLDIHTGSEPPTNGEPIWINPDEEPEDGGAVSPEAIKQAVDEYMAEHPETDPTVPDWAKQPNKPTYTAQEVGALPANTVIPSGGGERDWELFKTITIEEEVTIWTIGSTSDLNQDSNELGLKRYKEVLMCITYAQPTSTLTEFKIQVNNSGGGTHYRATNVLTTTAKTNIWLHISRVGELWSEILLGQPGTYATQYRVGYARTADGTGCTCCRDAYIVYLNIPQGIGAGSVIQIYGR